MICLQRANQPYISQNPNAPKPLDTLIGVFVLACGLPAVFGNIEPNSLI